MTLEPGDLAILNRPDGTQQFVMVVQTYGEDRAQVLYQLVDQQAQSYCTHWTDTVRLTEVTVTEFPHQRYSLGQTVQIRTRLGWRGEVRIISVGINGNTPNVNYIGRSAGRTVMFTQDEVVNQ